MDARTWELVERLRDWLDAESPAADDTAKARSQVVRAVVISAALLAAVAERGRRLPRGPEYWGAVLCCGPVLRGLMHALRHAYASVLLDAGESIKALSEFLGHSDPGFTLRTYTHLLPSSETRTRKAIDDAFTEAEAEEDGGTPEVQGTSVPRPNPCALNVPWPPDGPAGDMKKARPEDPAHHLRNPSSGPYQAVRLMPRLMQPMREVLPLMQQLIHIERVPRPAPIRHRGPDERRRTHRLLADAP